MGSVFAEPFFEMRDCPSVRKLAEHFADPILSTQPCSQEFFFTRSSLDPPTAAGAVPKKSRFKKELMDEPSVAVVVLDSAVGRLLDYSIPPDLQAMVKPGVRVFVPVKSTLRVGTVHTLKHHSEFSLAPIASLASEKSVVSEELFTLASWISKYWAAPLHTVMKLILPPSIRADMQEKRQLFVKPLLSRPEMADLYIKANGSPQAKIIEILLKVPQGMLASELLEKAAVSSSPL